MLAEYGSKPRVQRYYDPPGCSSAADTMPCFLIMDKNVLRLSHVGSKAWLVLSLVCCTSRACGRALYTWVTRTKHLRALRPFE